MHLSDRFGWRGFDGARVEVRPLGRTVRLGVFGGSALARGFDLPITSSGLNPLAEASWPTKRETMYGGLLAFWTPMAEARAGYQRIDDETTGGVSVERLAMDGRLAIGRNLTITGGADYDLAEASWGTGDLAVTYVQKPGGVRVTVGGRRYQPYFDLWSVWTAFSPVGYTAGSMSLSVPTVKGVELRARGETYAYEDAASNTPLVDVETDGWRWSVGARVTSLDWVTIDAVAHQELGPAAASLGYEGTATVAPMPGLTVSALTSWMRRPLEYRFDDAKVWTYGARAAYAVGGNADRRLFLDIRRHDETRERADAAELSWDQLRISGGITINLGSGADRRSLHPSILSLPDVPRSR